MTRSPSLHDIHSQLRPAGSPPVPPGSRNTTIKCSQAVQQAFVMLAAREALLTGKIVSLGSILEAYLVQFTPRLIASGRPVTGVSEATQRVPSKLPKI